jgi:predicted DNA-binding transcriptional regulator YafY
MLLPLLCASAAAECGRLRSWLLSFGAAVEVREPPALRAAMATLLRSAAHRYDP